MSFRLALCFAVVAAALNNVNALTPEELAAIKEPIRKFVHECNAEYNISEEQLKIAKETKSVDGIDPCAIACVFKKAHFINDEGKYDTEKAKERREKYVSSEEDRNKFAEITKECSAVNDATVSDGEKGCERAKLLLSCLYKHKDAILV